MTSLAILILIKKNNSFKVSISNYRPFTYQRAEAAIKCVLLKKVFLKNSSKFSGKHLCQSLLLKKRLWYWGFPVNFAKFLKMNSCFFLKVKKHLRWLLLFIDGAIPLRNFEFPKKGVSLLTKYFFSRNFQSFKFFQERVSCVKNGT